MFDMTKEETNTLITGRKIVLLSNGDEAGTINYNTSYRSQQRIGYNPGKYDDGQQHKIMYTICTIYRNARTATAAAQEIGDFILCLRNADVIDDAKVAIDVEIGKLHVSYKWTGGNKYDYTFNVRRQFGHNME